MTQESTTLPPVAPILTGAAVIGALYLTSLHSYLLFHSVIELFTVAVAVAVFGFAWNARHYLNNYLLFVGIAALSVALLDLMHTLAYEGMGVFGEDTSNLATQLWTAGRYLQGVSVLVAPFLLGRRMRPYAAVVGFALVTGFLLAAIFAWDIFPTAYVEGSGLTAFKKISEYVVSTFYLGAIGLLWWKRESFEPRVRHLLVASLALTIASEISFTSYVSVYGEANMVGHFFRLAAFYALYKAVIETGLVRPYAILLRDLKQSEDRLREYSTTLEARNLELQRTQDRLREDAVVLQQRNEELDAYAHTVAHDLKTPLTVIISNSELIDMAPGLTPEGRDDLVGRITQTALDMNSIIDSLLLLSEVRKADVRTGPVDMGAVVHRVLVRLEDMIREYAAEVVVADAWPTAIGYAPWLEEVWANYLSNALKHGGCPPRVALGASAHEGAARFWVRDNGPGVPPEARGQLFIPFSQLSRAHHTGHGLGLSIVYQIVAKLDGTVGVEGGDGGGSQFFFSLPTA